MPWEWDHAKCIMWRPRPPPPPYLLRYFISPSFVLDYSQPYLPYPFRFPPCSACESGSWGQNLVYWTVILCGKNVFPSIHAFPFNYLSSRFHDRRQSNGSVLRRSWKCFPAPPEGFWDVLQPDEMCNPSSWRSGFIPRVLTQDGII